MKMRNILIVVLALGSIGMLSSGCGKKGLPQPKNSADIFSWQRAKASGQSECITIDAELAGNLRNVDTVALELQTAGTAEDCPTCPFNPNERQEFTAQALGISSQQGDFTMQYCPKRKSTAYRWRLVGENVHSSLEHSLSTVRTVEMK